MKRLLGVLFALALPLSAQDLTSIEKRVTVRKLDNGLTIIMMERHEAPVFSYATVVNVGSAQEVPGITGLAHMFEHMAFKGSEDVGATNYDAERAALQKVEEAYAAYDAERRKSVGRDDAKVAQLKAALLATPDETLLKERFSFVRNGQPVVSFPMIGLIRTVVLNHSVHHRGQLSVYLRLMNIPVPAMYGTSADENTFD